MRKKCHDIINVLNNNKACMPDESKRYQNDPR
jgi:hypothetical protein